MIGVVTASVSSRSVDAVRERLLAFALSLPEAYEDHPWDETVAKVRRKVFVFFGGTPNLMTVKLVESHAHAISIEGTEPTRYGLGKSGWVNVPVGAPGLDDALLCDWIEESYRVIAPKTLAAALDEPSEEDAS
jgi:predicted DNA-binding protein (MmcQ/YjbR family)